MIDVRFKLAAVICVVSTAVSTGCSTRDPAFESIKSNPSPELMGIAERPVDVERNMAVVGDQNLRLFWSDLGRVWLFDQPSNLSPWNTISTSGQPN